MSFVKWKPDTIFGGKEGKPLCPCGELGSVPHRTRQIVQKPCEQKRLRLGRPSVLNGLKWGLLQGRKDQVEVTRRQRGTNSGSNLSYTLNKWVRTKAWMATGH